jgi:hypothetical protein
VAKPFLLGRTTLQKTTLAITDESSTEGKGNIQYSSCYRFSLNVSAFNFHIYRLGTSPSRRHSLGSAPDMWLAQGAQQHLFFFCLAFIFISMPYLTFKLISFENKVRRRDIEAEARAQ